MDNKSKVMYRDDIGMVLALIPFFIFILVYIQYHAQYIYYSLFFIFSFLLRIENGEKFQFQFI